MYFSSLICFSKENKMWVVSFPFPTLGSYSLSLFLSASRFYLIIFWCVFSNLPVSPGYPFFQSLKKNDSSLSLCHLPTRWLQLLLTKCQAESAPEISIFSLPTARFHTSTYGTICSWSVYATPSRPLVFNFPLSPAHTRSPPGHQAGARQQPLMCFSQSNYSTKSNLL